MCGILGSVNIDCTMKYLDSIKHRGPDASGHLNVSDSKHQVEFLHRRLSIIDLSDAGSQPMSSYDKQGVLIFNGEIYNHLELKSKLTGISFAGASDTETIVNYFRKFSFDKCIGDLNGIFGLAYLDKEKMQLYLARDRYGVKPLYYYYNSEQIIFSSEIRPIKSHLNPEIDRGTLLNLLKVRYTPAPFTIYSQVFKLEPGQVITIDLSLQRMAVKKEYFVKPSPTLGTRKGDKTQLVRIYGDLFEKAVERQLMSDVEVGVLLSGGIDSALVAAIANRKCQNKIKAFTIGFESDHPDVDEITFADETAQLLGLEHYCKRISLNDFLGSISNTVRIIEEPIGTTSIIPMYYLSELAASHVKVVLSGQGADEPLGGYYKYKGLSLLANTRILKKAFPNFFKRINLGKLKNDKARRFLSSVLAKDSIDAFIEYNSITSKGTLAELINANYYDSGIKSSNEKLSQFYSILKERTESSKNIRDLFLYYDLRTCLADDMLMYTDKITMNFSLECRVPILDNDLIDFVESLNSKYKFNTRNGKLIHKEFAKEYLPSTIINRKKLAFKSPAKHWFNQNHEQIIEAFASGQKFNSIFNRKAISKLLNDHSIGNNLENIIFLLLSLRYFLEDIEQNS
ncbi:MAG TPA: asparagine synthase (glutamine-hydrolyzing) [Sphingobacteriaceae bacterium]